MLVNTNKEASVNGVRRLKPESHAQKRLPIISQNHFTDFGTGTYSVLAVRRSDKLPVCIKFNPRVSGANTMEMSSPI
ncbi:MAG: hypothetical protein ACRCT2_07940, partial [Plesiomonas shigelloides]